MDAGALVEISGDLSIKLISIERYCVRGEKPERVVVCASEI
jgi:hypothetical protein